MNKRTTAYILLFVVALLGAQVVVLLQRDTRAAAAGTVTGVVFEDKTSDGAKGSGDPGVAGVAVAAFDATGVQVSSTTTGADGSYTLSTVAADATPLRVEFATPAGYSPSFIGTDNKSSVQFVTVGATNVSYGLTKPDEYCSNLFAAGMQGDQVASTCFQPSNAQTLATVNSTEWGSRLGTVGVATAAQTGSVWGLGYDGVRGLLWTSAAIRRYSPVGPQKLCGIYATNPATNSLVASFDLKSSFSLNCGDDTNFGTNQTTARDLQNSSEQAFDLPAYPLVGKAAFGDLDVSPDGQFLFVVNLHDQKVYRFTIGGTSASPTLSAAGSWAVNNLCSASGSVLRPWALEPISGTEVYVGSVCSGNETATPSATAAPESAAVQKMTIATASTATWSTSATVSLGYVRACYAGPAPGCSPSQVGDLSKWKAWSDNFTGIRSLQTGSSVLTYPQPILSDIDFLDDGSMVLGFIDRFSFQMGYNNLGPDATKTDMSLMSVYVHGDLLLFCKSGSSFVQEVNGECTGDAGRKFTTAHENAHENASAPNREFFDDNMGAHPELSQGGIAVKRGSGELAFTAMDPCDILEEGGFRFLNQSDGKRAIWPYCTTITSAGRSGSVSGQPRKHFGKSASMGDLEVICDAAPVQVGDRVWIDRDADGIQDPGEPGLANVTIKLKRVSDNLIWGSVKTDADGRYSFSSNVVRLWNDNSGPTSGGLVANEGFYLEVSDDWVGNNFGSGGSLIGYQLTTATQTTPDTANDTSVDSNATVTSTNVWRMQIGSLAPGSNNHTFDMGVTNGVSVGDKVFVDSNANGVQDPGEPGLAGAVLTLTDMSGNSVVNVNSQPVLPITTNSSGAYLFGGLPLGQYKVNITYPAGREPTLTGQGTSSTDSSSGTATSRLFTAVGQSDLTLDFGVVALPEPPPTVTVAATPITEPVVAMGNFTWVDSDSDGIQDPNEPTLPGVEVALFSTDGSPVRTIDGSLARATTDTNGRYLIDNLRPGSYYAQFTLPSGFSFTVNRGNGSSSANDSNPDPRTGRTPIFTIEGSVSGDTETDIDPSTLAVFVNPTIDAGVIAIKPVSVGNVVWHDRNGNGLQDAGEPGIPGATIRLQRPNGSAVLDIWGNPVVPQKTGDTGKFMFDNLRPGKYVVVVTYPPGWTPTSEVSGFEVRDSSTGRAMSRKLGPGEVDMTLDFGVVSDAIATLPSTM